MQILYDCRGKAKGHKEVYLAHRKLIKDGVLPRMQKQFVLTIDDEDIEYEFFKLLVLCVIIEQPRLFICRLTTKDPWEMYQRAKGLTLPKQQPPVEFHKFYEWISNDINQSIYNEDLVLDQMVGQQNVGGIGDRGSGGKTSAPTSTGRLKMQQVLKQINQNYVTSGINNKN